nr:hypothetical protein [Ethanoligenens harbinense]
MTEQTASKQSTAESAARDSRKGERLHRSGRHILQHHQNGKQDQQQNAE